MKKLIRIVSPSYLKTFKCTGSDCEDSCCIGWDIDIDKLTYRKYFRTKHTQMKNEFVKHVYKNEDCDCDEVDYGRVKINEEKWCPFLNKDKLCNIYSNLGEDFLSNVCYSFPRVYNIVDNVYECSLYMSCPEAVRQMLSQNEPIEFIEEEITLEKYIVQSFLDLKESQWKNSPLRKLKELRALSIEIVQDRTLSLPRRLMKLGSALRNLSSLKSSRDTNSFNTPDHCTFQMGFFKRAIDSLQVFSEIDSSVFIELTENLYREFRLADNISLTEKAKLYSKALESIIDPFLKDKSYLFEHYLVNFMFQGNFPFTENQNIFDGYLMLIARYSLMKFYLAGLGAHKGAIEKEDVVLIIQAFTKTVEHHKTFVSGLLEDIKQRDFDNMEFITLLLK